MNVAPSTLVDVDELREEIREQVQAQVRKQYRGYAIVLTVMALVAGVVIGISTMRERAQPGDVLTPPPYWGQMCVPVPGVDEIVSHPTATPQPLRVYVSGAVAQPGVVTLSAGSLLVDALDAAGGAADDADLEGVNLAAPLVDNQHVIVPCLEATPQPEAEAASESPTAALVDINTATGAELETLPHIGPAMAQRIIDYREAYGPFERIEDLQEVDGIGETRYKDLAPLITVEP
ncbi:MAG: ComEA family DNA-binding protein [Anaerolineae bacterium]